MYILVIQDDMNVKEVFTVMKYDNLDRARRFYDTMVKARQHVALYDMDNGQPVLLLTNMLNNASFKEVKS